MSFGNMCIVYISPVIQVTVQLLCFTCIWVLNQRSRWTCSNRQTWSRFHRPRWKCLWETWTTRCHRYGKCGYYSAWWRLSRQTPSCIRPESSHDFPGKSGSYSRQTVIQTAGWSKWHHCTDFSILYRVLIWTYKLEIRRSLSSWLL